VDLLSSAIKAVQSLPERNLLLKVFAGPFMEEVDRDFLFHLAVQDPRTTLQPFSPDFLAELLAADLSISMAGYNTCMDLLNTAVKAIVYPFRQNREQGLRAKKLESLGLVRVIERLDEFLLAKIIQDAMASPSPSPALPLNLAGAFNTSVLINDFASA
jgi:predicted glycosyltransferase